MQQRVGRVCVVFDESERQARWYQCTGALLISLEHIGHPSLVLFVCKTYITQNAVRFTTIVVRTKVTLNSRCFITIGLVIMN